MVTEHDLLLGNMWDVQQPRTWWMWCCCRHSCSWVGLSSVRWALASNLMLRAINYQPTKALLGHESAIEDPSRASAEMLQQLLTARQLRTR